MMRYFTMAVIFAFLAVSLIGLVEAAILLLITHFIFPSKDKKESK